MSPPEDETASPPDEQPPEEPSEQPPASVPSELPPEEPPVVSPPLLPLPPSTDTDLDGLTDVEESLYGTDVSQVDSDSDGYSDYQELMNGFNPNGSGRLVELGLGQAYVSQTAPSFTLVYPSSWYLERGSEADSDSFRLVASAEEFISFSVEPNTNGLSLSAWYRSIAPSVDPAALSAQSIGSHAGIYSPDRQTFYFIEESRPADVFVVSYNSGEATELNFRSTFEAIISSIAAAK